MISKQTILEVLGSSAVLKGNTDSKFIGLNSVYEASCREITWIKKGVKGETDLVNDSKAGGIICQKETFNLYKGTLENKLFCICPDPKRAFVKLVQHIDAQQSSNKSKGIHPTAIVHPDCELGENVSIGAYSIVGACKIGDHTEIYDHVKIHDPVTIGNNCVIREFCSIGGAGFGFSRNEQNENEFIPHIGYTIIEDNVHIYPFCNVDRGNLGMTKVGKGTVMDHHVHVSHNCIVGEHNVITAGVKFAGGASVGNYTFLGVSTQLKEKASVGSNCITGIGAVIIKDIPNNEIWVGNPAKFLKKNE